MVAIGFAPRAHQALVIAALNQVDCSTLDEIAWRNESPTPFSAKNIHRAVCANGFR
jgi:hypothetical protein